MIKLRENDFENKSIIVFALSMVANVLGVVFQVLAGRLLGEVSLYADLNSAMALFNIWVLPTTISTYFVAKYTAEFRVKSEFGKIKDFLLKVAFVLIIVILVYIFIMLFFREYIARWLYIDDSSVIVSVILLSGVTLLTSIFNGGFQGMQLFVLYGLFGLIGPFFKILAILVSTLAESKLLTIFGVWILGSLISYLIGTILLRKILRKHIRKKNEIRKKELFQYIYKLFVTNIGLILLMNIDILLVKHNFNFESGQYSAALVIGRTVTYFTGALVTVFFPMIAEGKMSETESVFLLKKTIVYNFILGIAVIVFINIFSKFLIRILLGDAFLECSKYLLPVTLYILPQSILNLLGAFAMANNKTKFLSISLLVSCCLEVIGSLGKSITLNTFIWYMVFVMWVVVIINIIYIVRKKNI